MNLKTEEKKTLFCKVLISTHSSFWDIDLS